MRATTCLLAAVFVLPASAATQTSDDAAAASTQYVNMLELIESYRDSGGEQTPVMWSNGYQIQVFGGKGSLEPPVPIDRAALFYVVEGKGTFTVDGESAPYGDGELIVVPPGAALRFSTSGRKPTEGFFLSAPPAARHDGTAGASTSDAGAVRLSSLAIRAPALFGDGWTGPSGLVIDDFDDLTSLPFQQRALAQTLKDQFAPMGVVAAADFTYRNASQPLELVTTRVFLFDSADSCEAWWKRKYRHEGWRRHYRPVDDPGARVVDSLETPKRAIAFGNVWMTSHQLQPGDDHLRVLEAYREAIAELLPPEEGRGDGPATRPDRR